MTGRSLLKFIIASAICLLAACHSNESDVSNHDTISITDTILHPPNDSNQLNLTDSLIDGRYVMRDMATDSIYEVLELDGLLVLRSSKDVLDTVQSFPYHQGLYGHTVTPFDSAFLTIEGVWRGNSASGEGVVYCIVNRQFVKSADITTHTYTGVPDFGEYIVNHTWERYPYRLQCIEMYDIHDVGDERTRIGGWHRNYTLRFDTLHHILYSDMIRLRKVPRQLYDVAHSPMPVDTTGRTITSNAVSGTFPGIAFTIGTHVFVDGNWYWLESKHGNAWDEPFTRGTQRPLRSGSGIAGDTLILLR